MKNKIWIFIVIGMMLMGSLSFASDCVGEPTAYCDNFRADMSGCNNHYETSGYQCHFAWTGHFGICSTWQSCVSPLKVSIIEEGNILKCYALPIGNETMYNVTSDWKSGDALGWNNVTIVANGTSTFVNEINLSFFNEPSHIYCFAKSCSGEYCSVWTYSGEYYYDAGTSLAFQNNVVNIMVIAFIIFFIFAIVLVSMKKKYAF